MSLMRWFRKNNKKIMAVVVIVIMIGFIGGSYLGQLSQRRMTGIKDVIAYYGDGQEITNYDRSVAQKELTILQMLGAQMILQSVGLPVFRAQDLQAVLLSELLFSDQQITPQLIANLKQMIRYNQYSISDKQINDIYRKSMPTDMYWFLLKKETEQAGIQVSQNYTRTLLGRIIPQVFNGQTYSQHIVGIVNRLGVDEKEILKTFGKLIAVLEYSKVICTDQAVTIPQIMKNTALGGETINVEFVKLDSAVFAESKQKLADEKINAHFDKFKSFYADSISQTNPYGFGYKLPDRVRLEYIAVKLDDIAKTIKSPETEEIETFYQRNRAKFTEQVPLNPDDPNSALTERIKSYAEMAGVIAKQITQDRINAKAKKIIQQARTLTQAESDPDSSDTEAKQPSIKKLRESAGNYQKATTQLRQEYGINIYTGTTGPLSAMKIQSDEYLGRLFLRSGRYKSSSLTQIAFALDELGSSELGPFDVSKPTMYENIGPFEDIFRQIMVLLRITEAQKASVPESIDMTFSTKTLELGETDNKKDEQIFSFKDKVTEDLRKLAAMSTTKSKAERFVNLAEKDGWNGAVEKFNGLYANDNAETNEQLGTFRLESANELHRNSKLQTEILKARNVGNPMKDFLINSERKKGLLAEHFYSLVPKDSNTVNNLPMILESKPEMSFYCLKNILVKRVRRDEYESIKATRIYTEDIIQCQNLAPVHLNPENILKRMNFSSVEQQPVESESAEQS